MREIFPPEYLSFPTQIEYEASMKHEQWRDLPGDVIKQVSEEHRKLLEERAARKELREMMKDISCVFAPPQFLTTVQTVAPRY